MARRDAVTAVTGKLFEEGWGRVGRNPSARNLGAARHMARAAQGASPAFFKLIRTGGCSSRQQLASQFTYLFSKSVDVHDSKGLLDGNKTLTPDQIERAVDRWADDWKGNMNAARTSHMVMSFPRGAHPRHVSLIAGEICREKLGGRFDYMIAVHTDSPNKNPHAHIIVNRRGLEPGDYFTLRHGTEYSYQTFKEAMVDHAKRYGIQLEATTRLQRGHVNYPPTDAQWRRAKEHAAETNQPFASPAGKPRVGASLARAMNEIRDWSLRYRDLSSFASAGNMQDLANALERAGRLLEQGGVVTATGDPYMTVNEDFDRAASDLKDAVDRAERSIAEAAPNHRPEMERQLTDIMASIQHLQPLGPRSAELSQAASSDGIYSAQNVTALSDAFTPDRREKLISALDGTGIDPVEVEARMRGGANSAALETRWIQQDLQSVADLRGLDLRNEAHLQQALDVVNDAHDRIAAGLGIDDAIERRTMLSETGTDTIPDYEARFPGGDTRLADEISDEARRAQEQEDAELDTADQMARSREADALEHSAASAIGITETTRQELRQYAHPVGEEEERRLREAVERALTKEEIERLKRGDVSTLNGVGSREDQLVMARDYLRATNDPTAKQGLDRVNEQIAAEREHLRRERGHEGGGHE